MHDDHRLDCLFCDSPIPTLLGYLGSLAHLRCNACGSTYNVPAEWTNHEEEVA